jgi:hypothetical protein
MSGKIFINYRRGHDHHFAGRLWERLSREFKDGVFLDVDNMPGGKEFKRHLEKQVGECEVFLALIGPQWIDAQKDGHRRLGDSEDFVRVEIESALKLGKSVIPVLDGIEMPLKEALPEPIQPLAGRQAVRLTHEHFATDCDKLVSAVRSALAEAEYARDKDKPMSFGGVLGMIALFGPVLAAMLWGALVFIQSNNIWLSIMGWFAALISAIAIVAAIVSLITWVRGKFRHRASHRAQLIAEAPANAQSPA